jgi:hypothetical protein
MQTNKLTSKNYQVISVYDQYHSSLNPNGIDNIQQIDRYHGRLPNVPLVARNTLLAQRLRNGTYMTDGVRYRPLRNHDERRSVNVKTAGTLLGKLIGVEIEYYPSREDRIKTNQLTDVTGDGSLDCGGAEIRRLTWASKTGRLEGLLALKIRGKINRKCGLHVHVDARHLGGESGLLNARDTYARLILLYPMLKKLVPRSRLRNSYCRWRDSVEYCDRYCAINFQSFGSHGTIEFRCQGGTVNLLKIESWALLCQFLVNFCANPANTVPTRWTQFLAILPEPLRSWCLLRKQKLYGDSVVMNERTMSAMSE